MQIEAHPFRETNLKIQKKTLHIHDWEKFSQNLPIFWQLLKILKKFYFTHLLIKLGWTFGESRFSVSQLLKLFWSFSSRFGGVIPR